MPNTGVLLDGVAAAKGDQAHINGRIRALGLQWVVLPRLAFPNGAQWYSRAERPDGGPEAEAAAAIVHYNYALADRKVPPMAAASHHLRVFLPNCVKAWLGERTSGTPLLTARTLFAVGRRR